MPNNTICELIIRYPLLTIMLYNFCEIESFLLHGDLSLGKRNRGRIIIDIVGIRNNGLTGVVYSD